MVLMGDKGKRLEELRTNEIEPLEKELATYDGKLATEFVRTAKYQLLRAETFQSDEYFAAYLGEAKTELGAIAGFPLINDTNKTLPREKFEGAYKRLSEVAADLGSTNFVKYKYRNRSDWKTLTERIEGQLRVARALQADEGRLVTCSISLARTTEDTRTKDVWRETWRERKLSFLGGNGDWTREEKVGDAPVDRKFDLQLRMNLAGSATYTHSIGDWGSLWLIHRYKGTREPDGKTWLVEFPVGAPGAAGAVRLKLTFEHGLPELDKWPAQ